MGGGGARIGNAAVEWLVCDEGDSFRPLGEGE